jgi:uncharacterized protein YxjI
MSTYYLRPQFQLSNSINLVYDEQFHAVYLLDASRGGHQLGAYFILTDMKGHELARITQTSSGILPRFTIQLGEEDMGSFSLTLGGVGDLVYIRRLNWVISGNTLANRYIITHRTQKLLGVSPTRRPDGLYIRLRVTHDEQAVLHILIAAFLDRAGLLRLPEFKRKLLQV